MKKFVSILAFIMLLVAFASSLFAASSVTPTWTSFFNMKTQVLKLAVIAHTDGTVTAYPLADAEMSRIYGTYLCGMETDPGTTAPTTLYDITITNAAGTDVLGGTGANRSATATEAVVPVIDSATGFQGCRIIGSALTLNVSGNAVNGATVDIRLFFVRP